MAQHTIRQFDLDLEQIRSGVLAMGGLVEKQLERATTAIEDQEGADLKDAVGADEQAINRMQMDIDQQCTQIIAKRQPAAVDLRFVAAMMKITPELERIGDLAQDVCERAIELNREPQLKAMIAIPRLAQDAQTMVRQALDAFVRGDANLARQVIAMDDSIDQQTEQSFRELLTYMLEDPRNISRAIRLTFTGKYFERMADGATNICEMVVYLVEGKMIKHVHDEANRAR
jgi:phosphate transport system protein